MTLFQVGKQFDALLVDTSAPVFGTFESDTRNVSISLSVQNQCSLNPSPHSHKAKKGEGEPGRETGAIVHVQHIAEVKQTEQWKTL